MRYDVVLVTENSEKWLQPCVAALRSVRYPLGEVRLIFCDNASTDGTRETLRRLRAENAQQGAGAFGGFEVVENEKGSGFSAACNRGAARGDAPMILFLYVDARVDAGIFTELDDAAKRHPDAGGFECRRTPYESGRHIDPVTMETTEIGGAALAIPRAVFAEAGGFDEHFDAGHPDAYVPMDRRQADLSWRIRAAGRRLYYAPFARVACAFGEGIGGCEDGHGCGAEGGDVREGGYGCGTEDGVCEGGPANRGGDSPGLRAYAGGLYGDLLLRYKFGGMRAIREGHKRYLDALRRPQHFDGVRRVLAKNYLRHAAKLWPFLFWRFAHRAEYAAGTACFAGGLSAERGTCALLPAADGPLVSVIVRTCGRPETLRRTLQSLRWQTWRNFEIVVTEDGPDTARSMLETEFAGLPIRYLNDGVRHGRAANGNRGLAAAKGTLCNFLDDDDFFYPDHLELLVGFWCAHPEADLVLGSAMALFCLPDGTAAQLEPMIFDRIDRFSMCQNCRIPIQTVLFRRSLFEQYGGLIETLDAHEDWGMWLKYLEHGRRITPHAPDIRRATSIFVQPAGQEAADARIEAYRKSDDAFFADPSLQFTVTLADMRRYYDDMIADLRCVEARGELHEYLEREAKRGG